MLNYVYLFFSWLLVFFTWNQLQLNFRGAYDFLQACLSISRLGHLPTWGSSTSALNQDEFWQGQFPGPKLMVHWLEDSEMAIHMECQKKSRTSVRTRIKKHLMTTATHLSPTPHTSSLLKWRSSIPFEALVHSKGQKCTVFGHSQQTWPLTQQFGVEVARLSRKVL